MCLFSSGVTGRLSLPSSCGFGAAGGEIHRGVGEGVQTPIAGAPVAQVLLTCRTEVVGSVS